MRFVLALVLLLSGSALSSLLRQDGETGGAEGLVEEYVLAWQAAQAERAEHGGQVDPDTDTQARLAAVEERLAEAGISPSDLDLEGSSDSGSGDRRKRTYGQNDYWNKGYVPYIYESSIGPWHKLEIQRTLQTYGRFTCIRGVPWENKNGTTTNDELQLGHPSYLKFLVGGGCWSILGNIHSSGGQSISCCGGTNCIHELGHALGMYHEQNVPSKDRDWIIRINPDWIQKGYADVYAAGTSGVSHGYDLSSYMHYRAWMFSGSGPSFTNLFPEIMDHNSYYYLMMEVSYGHKCADTYCKNEMTTCENDGYFTLVDGKCQCRCIQGLDPDSRCSKPLSSATSTQGFPGGSYALPQPNTGCPNDKSTTGQRTHYNDGGNSISSPFNLKGGANGGQIEQNFCVTEDSANTLEWPAGCFCIYRRGGKCPEGFEEGYIQYDDNTTSAGANSKSGDLPDGVYDQNTKIEFCCRDSSFADEEIFIPNRKPLVLIKHPDRDCQAIRGMHSYVQQMTITSSTDEGLVKVEGHTPVLTSDKGKTAKIEYCYYEPATIDCGGVYSLDDQNPTVTVESPSGAELECSWHFKVPIGENLILKFDEFSIEGQKGKCEDKMEIRYYLPAQNGYVYCGPKLDMTFRSINHTIHIRLSTFGNTQSKFKATATFLKRDDLSYRMADRGTTYVGKVNVTRNFQPCLPWSEVAHCPHHQGTSKDGGNILLESNYCRNPDYNTGIMPWCYYRSYRCLRNYCDVSQKGTFYDADPNCQALKEAGLCTNPVQQKTAWETCALTCKDDLPALPAPTPLSTITCPTPEASAVDGTLEEANPKSSYSVGSTVTYKCSGSDVVRERVCLTSGEWSPMGIVCDYCPKGWFMDIHDSGVTCYSPTYPPTSLQEARDGCKALNAELMTAKTAEENAKMREKASGEVWLPIQDDKAEGTWVWDDGAVATGKYTNWGGGQPDNWGYGEDCAVMKSGGTWNDIPCSGYHYRYMCRKAAGAIPHCADFSGKCEEALSANPDFCSRYPDFAYRQCAHACGTCEKDSTSPCTVPSVQYATVEGAVSSVARGGMVTYVCKDGFVSLAGDAKRICLASGSLSGTELQCVPTCPDGWSFLDETKSCYKLFPDVTSYPGAVAKCADFNALPVMPKTSSQLTFVATVTNKKYVVWLGLTDQEVEGTFKWADDTILHGWSNWYWWEPNNYGNREDCVTMLTGTRWNDIDCGNSKMVLCQASVDKVASCVDSTDTCEKTVQADPDYCTRNDKKNCLYTCGLCKQDDSPKCNITVVANTETAGSQTVLSRGQIAKYSCTNGFGSSSGDAKRICLASGSLSGQDLVCVQQCPDGWAYLESTNTCYKVFDGAMKYDDVLTKCANFSGLPIMLKTADEYNFVMNLISGKEASPWLGLTDRDSEGIFKWADGTVHDKTTDWHNWSGGEPNDWGSGEDCTYMKSYGRWNDQACGYTHEAICQVPKDSFPPIEQ